MEIIQYDDSVRNEVIDLILGIQNREAKINLTLEEQPDLLDIRSSYISNGGNFWVAMEDGAVAGTIGLMRLDEGWCVLKKFFVRGDFRSKKVGLALYQQLHAFAMQAGMRHIILDTPAVATKSHSFYERAGFRRVTRAGIGVDYHYPDRDSILYRLDL